jgi:predicted ATPase
VLGITQQPGKSVSESVAAAMEGTIRLLVIDNCEHVREAAADLVEAILAQSVTVKVLATSREGLRVGDEQAWLVPSLDVGAGTDSAAVALFVERARSEASQFSAATPDEAAAVVEICRRLDGIPLAIELAASRMASMTAGEVRDRLDQRFRLLVGSRRALERHHTLRHAVAWSFELLDDTEKALLERCSVFAGGFDLQSACAVAAFGDADDLVVLDLLDALVRKSLLVADRSAGRTRYSMLETIRQFAEEQLVARGQASEIRAAHSRYFADRETDIMALWDSPRQRGAYTWFTAELSNLRNAFRWAADEGDLDSAAALAFYAGFLGLLVEQYEPAGWAEELIETARRVNHRRLAQLYVVAAACYSAGRIDDAVGYLDASRRLTESGDFDEIFYELQNSTGIVYAHAGQSERWAELCRSAIGQEAGPQTITRASLVMAFYFLGQGDEARAASQGLLADADTSNPLTACFALLAHGLAYYDADPAAAYDALRRALTIAQESGNRQLESASASTVLLVAVTYRDPVECFETVMVLIRRYYDVGNVALLLNPLAILVSLLDGLGHHEQAAVISGFAASVFSLASYPQLKPAIAHLRGVFGDQTYESLARTGEAMSTADMVAYAYDQIDQAIAALNAVS